MGYLGAILTKVRARSWHVTQRCHNNPDGKWGYRVRMTSRTGSAWRIWGILKKVSWVESCRPKKKGDFRLLTEALGRCHTRWWGCRWKSQNRKNVYLSPYVEEPLNSKVIKSFVPGLRSRKCFLRFEIPVFYVYMLWTFHIRFTHIHIMGMVQ